MAQLTIQMQRDPDNGETTFRVALLSEDDATPSEHERNHRRYVSRLLPGVNLDTPGDNVTVARERPLLDPLPSCGCDGGDGYEVIDL